MGMVSPCMILAHQQGYDWFDVNHAVAVLITRAINMSFLEEIMDRTKLEIQFGTKVIIFLLFQRLDCFW